MAISGGSEVLLTGLFCFAVDAAVNTVFRTYQTESVLDLLFGRSDAARIIAGKLMGDLACMDMGRLFVKLTQQFQDQSHADIHISRCI